MTTCGYKSIIPADSVASDTEVAEIADATSEATHWADSIMSTMTLEQLVGQLFLPAVYSDASPASLRATAAYAADLHVGGVVLLKGNVTAARALSDTLRALSVAPPFMAIDAEWGLAMRLSDTPKFPKNGEISPSAEDTLLYDYGTEVARECRLAGVNMVLGPVLDVLPSGGMNGTSAVIGNRSFGSDPVRVAQLGVAYARGLEDGGVVSVAKHFPGHGSADADSHRALPFVRKSAQDLYSQDILPFARYVDSQLSGIMLAHVAVPSLDSSEVPASVSKKIINDVLRDSLGFRGLVLTDAMNMHGADGFSSVDALRAGADIIIAPADTRSDIRFVLEAVRRGDLTLASLRAKVRRILFRKYFLATSPSAPITSPSSLSRSLINYH